jgi:[acyl-carrier-protein] S-malonyltransferase
VRGGAFSLADTARLLKLRGQSMQAAVPVGVGAMAALLGADIEKASALAAAAAEGEVCTVANDNDPGQVVLSGHRARLTAPSLWSRNMASSAVWPCRCRRRSTAR